MEVDGRRSPGQSRAHCVRQPKRWPIGCLEWICFSFSFSGFFLVLCVLFLSLSKKSGFSGLAMRRNGRLEQDVFAGLN